jgi:hypothetical protein
MHPHQAAAAIDELDQALPQRRVRKQVAHGVVQEDRVELPQAFGPEHRTGRG